MKLVDTLAFGDVYAEVKDQKMPMRIAYKFSRAAEQMAHEAEYYRDKLRELIDTYVVKDEEGKPQLVEDGEGMKIKAGMENECAAAINELQSIEVEVKPVFDIEDLESLELTPVQTRILLPFIIEE